MTYSEINNIELPQIGDNLPVSPSMFNDGIKTLDVMKIQYVNAEYVVNGTTALIVLEGNDLNYKQIEDYCKNKAYQFNVKKDNNNLSLIKLILYNETTPTNGNIVFGGIFDVNSTIVCKLITVKSTNGIDISELTYTENTLLNTSSKVTALNSSVTNDQYPSAKAVYDFVTSSVNANAAYYITKTASGDPFATKAELDAATTFYSGGVVRVPGRNDYCIVETDETHSGNSCRYIYQNNQWEFQYNYEKQFTAAQMNAINSGITAAKISTYEEVIQTGVESTAMTYNSTTNKIIQNETDVTDDVASLIISKDVNTYIEGVSGTDYGESAVVFTKLKYLWCGSSDPGESVRNTHKNTLFVIKM